MERKCFTLILVMLSAWHCDTNQAEPEIQRPGAFEVTIVRTAPTSAEITWTLSEGAEHYQVYLETEKIADAIDSTAFLFADLVADVVYTGTVVAVNSAGETIVPFTFRTAVKKWPTDHLTVPRKVSIVYRKYGMLTMYQFVDSLDYQYAYDALGRIEKVIKTKRRYDCPASGGGFHDPCTFLASSTEEVFEFQYSNRKLSIFYFDDNSILQRTLSFSFNNDSYILPEHAVIASNDPNIAYDSMTFSYDQERQFLTSIKFFKGSAAWSISFRNRNDDIYLNGTEHEPGDTLKVNYTQFIAPVNQYCGMPPILEPDMPHLSMNVLFYPLSILKHSRHLAAHLTENGPSTDEINYSFTGDMMTGFTAVYVGWTGQTYDWRVSIEYE